jgi:hypothetical protein
MSIMILRRPRLGMGSVRGLKHWGNGRIDWVRNDRMHRKDWSNVTHVVRWGCTSTVPGNFSIINTASAIHRTADKAGFRRSFQNDQPIFSIPSFGDGWGTPILPCVVRPRTHSRGLNLFPCYSVTDLMSAIDACGEGWYGGELIPKEEEYRIYVVGGRAAAVARKVVEDKSVIAWNRAQGQCEFNNVRWGQWPLLAVKAGIDAVNHLGLDFGGADIMVDKEGRPYVLEVNSAPSLPLHDHQSGYRRFTRNDIASRATYRQQCFANALIYTVSEGHTPTGDLNNWRDAISPGVSEEAQ